jgi:polyferredoxin
MRLQIKRLWSQILFVIGANLGALGFRTGFCYPFFYCHACPAASAACPLRAIEKSFYDHSFNWRLLLYPVLILGFVGTLTGRAVCGWACPIGFLQRGTGNVARRLRKIPLVKKFGQLRIEPYFRYIKYLVLIGTVIITPFFIKFMFTDVCPTGMLVGTFPLLIVYPGKFVPNPFFWYALIVFILFFVMIFLIERGWCRYFCPVGAILAPFNKVSYIYVSVNKDECIHCNICSTNCPMGIDIPNMNRDPECILCGKCISKCPKNGIKYERI